jgi:hypothetical protein
MANIDYQLLRDWYSSNYYTGIPLNMGKSRDKESKELREFWKEYVQSRPIEIDPRVKYRIANKEAIKQFDDTGKITGTTRYSGSEDIPAVFFAQGQPLHQYAAGALSGRGTAFSEQQPYLIATVGDNWGSSTSLNNTTLDQVNRYSLIDSVYDRVGEDAQGFVKDSRWRLEELKKQVGKVRNIDQLNNILGRIEELQAELPNFAGAVERHLHGSPARGYGEGGFPDFASYYGIEGWDTILSKPDHYIPDNLFDLEILRDGYDTRGLTDGSQPITSTTRDLLKRDIQQAINGFLGIEDTFNIDPKKLTQFHPYPSGKFSSGRDKYAIPDWVRSNQQATSLLPSDTELFEKIAKGQATPEEIEKVYGLGGLREWSGGGQTQKRLFINNPKSRELARVENIIPALGASQGAMSSEVLPRTLIEDDKGNPTWSITSPSVEVGNYRPFAIWQYTKNGLRLINQGNNDPVVGGVKPIPTGRVDSDLVRTNPSGGSAFRGRAGEGFIDFFGVGDKVKEQFNAGKYFQKWATQEELGQMSVKDAVKKFGKQGWKRGFVAVPEFLEKGVGNLVMDAKVTMANADAFRTQYVNNEGFRGMTNKYIGGQVPKVAVGALAGLHLKSKIDEGMPISQAVPVTAAEIGIGVAKFKLFDRYLGGVGEISPISDTSSAAHKEFIAARREADARRAAETKAKLSSYENSSVSDWPSHNPATWMLNGQ